MRRVARYLEETGRIEALKRKIEKELKELSEMED